MMGNLVRREFIREIRNRERELKQKIEELKGMKREASETEEMKKQKLVTMLEEDFLEQYLFSNLNDEETISCEKWNENKEEERKKGKQRSSLIIEEKDEEERSDDENKEQKHSAKDKDSDKEKEKDEEEEGEEEVKLVKFEADQEEDLLEEDEEEQQPLLFKNSDFSTYDTYSDNISN